MKNFLLLLIPLLAISCTKEIEPTAIEIQAEFNDLSIVGIFGTWELLDNGPLSCPGDYYTFNEDTTYEIVYSIDCNQVILFPIDLIDQFWTGDENSFSLSVEPTPESTYTILSKDENSMNTSIPKGDFFDYQNWRKID